MSCDVSLPLLRRMRYFDVAYCSERNIRPNELAYHN